MAVKKVSFENLNLNQLTYNCVHMWALVLAMFNLQVLLLENWFSLVQLLACKDKVNYDTEEWE